jgi:Zn-dependent peptidase ImmA (M78 family)
MKIRWLPRESIARRASEVLQDYEQVVAHPVHPPIPVEDIIERCLGLNLSFEDLETRLGMGDVLGAIFVEFKEITIDKKLLEDKSEGRMIFTCAHEAGHWVLHRHFVEQAARKGAKGYGIICRKRDARLPEEWQADYFASCLLMPEQKVVGAFSQVWGGKEMVLDNVRSRLGGTSVCVDPCVENWPLIADAVRDAGRFSNVSKEAMIIRLKELGLVRNKTQAPMGWRRTA